MTQQRQPEGTADRARALRDEDADPYGWREEGRDLLRAVAAGSIVGMPLLYTMEMWRHGMTASEWHLLLLLAASLVVNFVFSLSSGFRHRYSPVEAASESVTAVALGMVYSFAVLWLIGEVGARQPWSENLGKVLIETAPVSLGISFANYQMRNRTGEGDGDDDGEGNDDEPDPAPAGGGPVRVNAGTGNDPERMQLKEDLRDLGATVGGATVFAYNIAPTEEIVAISSRLSGWHHLAIVATSLVLCYMILFAAGFRRRPVYVPGPFQSPLAETVMAYAVALAVAFGLLYLVGDPEAMGSGPAALEMTVTLGLPAVVGAAAGRLVT